MKNAETKYNIALCAINTRYSQSSIAIDYLSAYLEKYMSGKPDIKESYDLKIFEFNLTDSFEFMARALCREDIHLYCFSVYIWNREITARLISFIKKAFPEAFVLVGGPEVVSACAGESEAMIGADVALCGEGEWSFARFVELKINYFKNGMAHNFINKDEFCAIPGIAISGLNGPEAFFYSSEPAVFDDPDELPSIYDAYMKLRTPRSYVYLETSRGCPNHCYYCLSSLKPSGKPAVRRFSMERVFSDIDKITDTLKIEKVRVIDRTFNEDPERALKIFKHIAAKNIENMMFQFEMSPYKFTPELLDFLRTLKKKCFQFEIGIQSFDSGSLDSVGRGDMAADVKNIEREKKHTPSEILDILINETRVEIHADLMFGLPADTVDSCIGSFDALLMKMPDSVQFWQLKMLRGTRLRNEAEKLRMAYESYPPYAVIRTPKMSVADIFRLQKLGRYLDLLYNHGHIKNSVGFLFGITKSPSWLFFSIIEHFEKNNIAETAVSRSNLFQYIKEFAERTVKIKNERHYDILLDYLRLDFIEGEKKRFSMPEFLEKPYQNINAGLFSKILESFDAEKRRIKISKTYSFHKFSYDISGNGRTPEKKECALVLKHLVNPDGSFGAEKQFLFEKDMIKALDFLSFADKNRYARSENSETLFNAGLEGVLKETTAEILAGIESLRAAGIVL
ncbi:MAG TPA: DUF4080 domain-containing protein [Candidatus Wallbacteria bacterium]|nr:DUF4080 domain-containing protein [Candidatus Wallbacteria bacterium]